MKHPHTSIFKSIGGHSNWTTKRTSNECFEPSVRKLRCLEKPMIDIDVYYAPWIAGCGIGCIQEAVWRLGDLLHSVQNYSARAAIIYDCIALKFRGVDGSLESSQV